MMNYLPRSEGEEFPGMASGVFRYLSQRMNQYFFSKTWGPVSRRVTACQWKHRMQDSVSRRVTGVVPDLRILFMEIEPFWLIG